MKMNKLGGIELSARWIVRIVLGFVLLSLVAGLLIGVSGIVPFFIIGVIFVGLVIEVLWHIMTND